MKPTSPSPAPSTMHQAPGTAATPPPSLDPYERVCAGASLLSALLGVVAVLTLCSALCGCYSNTGSSTAVGDITALPEISDAADNLCVKVYYSMTGARVWTAKDSLVKITYANDYTNSYCGVIDTRGNQRLSVEIEPLAEAAPDADGAAKIVIPVATEVPRPVEADCSAASAD